MQLISALWSEFQTLEVPNLVVAVPGLSRGLSHTPLKHIAVVVTALVVPVCASESVATSGSETPRSKSPSPKCPPEFLQERLQPLPPQPDHQRRARPAPPFPCFLPVGVESAEYGAVTAGLAARSISTGGAAGSPRSTWDGDCAVDGEGWVVYGRRTGRWWGGRPVRWGLGPGRRPRRTPARG